MRKRGVRMPAEGIFRCLSGMDSCLLFDGNKEMFICIFDFAMTVGNEVPFLI